VDLNLNSLNVDANGRVSFSGLNSGIDFRAAVDAIIAARSIPIDTLETRISGNEDKIAALNLLRTNLSVLRDSLANLYGAVNVGNAGNIFENKQAFATTSRLDGGAASLASNLIGVTVTNAATTGSRDIEILQTARAHKISSDSITSATASLGLAGSDSFTLEGVVINVDSNTTLQDLRDRINKATKLDKSPIGVSASIVSVGANENFLLLTKNDTGQPMTIADTTGTPLQTLGILTAGGSLKNELQAAQQAQFYADGIKDTTNTIYESGYLSGATAQIGSAGTMSFTLDADSSVIGTVAYNATDTIADLATAITAQVAGVTATVVTDGAGARLEISGAAPFSIAETGGGTAINDLDIDNKRRVIARDSNTISDLFNGITLNLFQAEQGTTLKLTVESDLSAVKTEIAAFVEAYNAVKLFINQQRLIVDPEADNEEGLGRLVSSRALTEVQSSLSLIIGQGAVGVGGEFSILAQIGIDFIDNGSLSDPLLADTLVIDESKLDVTLLNNADDVRRMFAFDFSSSDPRISLLGFDGNTKYSATGYTVNIQPNQGSNLLLYSEQADNAYWDPRFSTVTADAIAGPFGTTTADALVADATSNIHYLTTAASTALTAGDTYTFSTYAKAGDQTSTRLNLAGGAFGGPAVQADFDLTNGTVSNVGLGVDSTSVENVGNGWYRVSVTATATATGNATFERYAKAAGGTVFTGDGATASTYFWGAQLTQRPDNVRITAPVATRGSIITSPTVTDPDGGLTTQALVADTENNSHFVASPTLIQTTAGKSYTFESYVQAGSQTKARLVLGSPAFPTASRTDFDLSNGTIAQQGAGADSASITDVGGGWYRISITATATATSGAAAELYAVNASTGLGYVGANDPANPDLFFWEMRVRDDSNNTAPTYVRTTGQAATNVVASANIDGATNGFDDGSTSVANQIITVDTGNATGLRLFYQGLSETSAAQLDFSIGLGAQMFFKIDQLMNVSNGIVQSELDALDEQNTFNRDNIEAMKVRLEIQRQDLLERFIRMETAIATSQRIIDSIQATTEAAFGNN
jgi:flagellar hook-associated protein 2